VQSQIIGSFIKQIDKQPMILVGHSYGGPMVAKLAADHPSWYKHVVIPRIIDPKAENQSKRTVVKSVPLRDI
jgi:pimeloyl-ACP methyl ester carboxylesterase